MMETDGKGGQKRRRWSSEDIAITIYERPSALQMSRQPQSQPSLLAVSIKGSESCGDGSLRDEEVRLLEGNSPTCLSELSIRPSFESKLKVASNISWAVNFILLAAKLCAYILSGSKAVLASLVDSLVDLLSQAIISGAAYLASRPSDKYPVGRNRLEAIAVLACACIMSVSAFEVIKASCMDLFSGFIQHDEPHIDVNWVVFTVLGVATVLKLVCYVMCNALKHKSDSMQALAEDHLNDIASNIGAAVTAAIAGMFVQAWSVDPFGAIGISAWIVWRWYEIAKSQVDKIVGRAAPEELISQLQEIAHAHYENLAVDVIRAYHFGAKFMVEMEVVMPADMTLREVHDISLMLQHKLEAVDEVERAFVHVDYAYRDQPEHRTERKLLGLPMVLESPAEGQAMDH